MKIQKNSKVTVTVDGTSYQGTVIGGRVHEGNTQVLVKRVYSKEVSASTWCELSTLSPAETV